MTAVRRDVLAVADALQPRTVYLKGLTGNSVTLYGSREEAMQFLAALAAAGFVVVPKRPEHEMSLAGVVVLMATEGGPRDAGEVCDRMWEAMIAAALRNREGT